jgi:patatin-like phospholipase/acyl hydrolase
VVATKETGGNNSAPVLFRSYKNPLEMSELPDIKIWQAARATSAAPTYFDHMTVGNITFMDGGLQANNPLGWYASIPAYLQKCP